MVGMEMLVSFVFYFCISVVTCSPNSNNGTTDPHQHIKQLEETVSDLQKHVIAQEQKQRVILSDVLSKLIMTTNSLNKVQHDYMVLENEVSSLKENLTAVAGAEKSCTSQEVAFEASMANKDEHNKNIIFKANETLMFPSVQYNQGGCWNSSNGVFTATVNGTYQFWINLSFTHVKDFTLLMKRNYDNAGQTHGSQQTIYLRTTLSLTSITQMIEGDHVYFVVDRRVTFLPADSSCGGVILHSDVQ